MDFGSILNIGADLLKNRLNLDEDGGIGDAISTIFKNANGEFDFTSILSSLSNGNLSDIVSSWISNGENSSIDSDGIVELLGKDKINEFANKLGVDFDSAIEALKDIVPNVVDKATPEGKLPIENLNNLETLFG